MTVRDGGSVQRGPLRWPSTPGFGPRRPEPNALYVYLLDADAELAEEFDMRGRIAVRQLATARVLQVGVGDCDLSGWFDSASRGPGLLILDGLIAFETRTGDRVATELLGSGDLLQAPALPTDDLLERSCRWRALRPTRFALLDKDFVERVRPFPQVVRALLSRACRRTAELDVLRAITSQPRLEVRLVLVLWHLAARWGKVEPAAVRLSLPLTHRLLGQLVAAERPSISHALKRLAQAGLVSGSADDLRLHGTLEDQLESLFERHVPLVQAAAPGVSHAR
ncbi:MAG TPA: Crp/Fnr family transcriptional regulator [Solirubrobacteraceae bacterium]|nr:Crp/Fnr family transcriptional regulator [Solirubrobacteraceae bacterium]